MESALWWVIAQRLVRAGLVVVVDPLVQRACAVLSVRNTWVVSNSVRRVRWNRSILPVVVGERGAVRRCSMPFSRQIRSKRTSTGGWWNRPVNTFPLSVRICCGTPWARIAHASPSQTG
jgi:hypothetical protein